MSGIEGHTLIVTQGEAAHFSLPVEPRSYTRMVAGAWWKEGSPEAKYVEWKRVVRETFDKLDCRTYGMPYQEPLLASGSFHLADWSGRDLDNLIKGILDCMNPKVRKNGKDLETFAWIDDRQIMSYNSWSKNPSETDEIDVTISPFWGRVAPWIPYTTGRYTRRDGGYIVSSAMGSCALFPVNLAAPSSFGPAEGDTCTLFLWPQIEGGRYTAFTNIEQWMLYREVHRTKGVGAAAFYEVCRAHPWSDMALGLGGGSDLRWACEKVKGAKLARLFNTLRTVMPDPLAALKDRQDAFSQATFEECAKQVSMAFGEPWPHVRAYMQSLDINWLSTSPEEMISLVAQLMPSWAVKKTKKPKAPKAPKAKKEQP